VTIVNHPLPAPLVGTYDFDHACEMYERIASGSTDEFMLYVVIPGAPPSKARPRHGKGFTYVTPESRAAEARTALFLTRLVAAPLEGNVALGCVFFRPNKQRIDTDNMLKHVCDAANGVLWVDDSQVTAVMGITEYDAGNPRTLIVVGRHASSMTRGADDQYPCVVCGAAIVAAGQNRRKTCSKACAFKARGMVLLVEPVPCEQCGVPFKRINKYQRFCTRDCAVDSFRSKRKSHALPFARCSDCDVELTHRRGGRCRACWAASVAS
jgi:Holliday junction resolvase RusA-like endonuclease/predicted nucleic acid-binding Zn ribbon protein